MIGKQRVDAIDVLGLGDAGEDKMLTMPLPRITPLRLGRRVSPFSHPDWLFELKWDGFRAVAYIEKGQCRLVSRKGNTFKSWPALCSTIASLNCEDAILDGEIVCLDQKGKADFNSLLFRREEPLFYGFDILWHDGNDLRQHSLIERKDILKRLLKNSPDRLRYVEHFDGTRGEQLFEVCSAHDVEGVVAKRRDSTYLERDHETAWLKVKNRNYTGAAGRDELFEARGRSKGMDISQ
jgi:bifunctional non-homologous end joining protein LigD